MRDTPLARIVGDAQTKTVQEALKPYLHAAGVQSVEQRIGKPHRFFENVRYRGTLRLRDYLATCTVLEIEPGGLITQALGDEVAADIRRPRFLASAWKRIREDGPGLGDERLAELEVLTRQSPGKGRALLSRGLRQAACDEVPRILGLCASSFRVENDLARANLVLKEAAEIARTLELPAAEADLLVRRAYVCLENEHPLAALQFAERATVSYTRLDDREGQAKAFLAMGSFRFYIHDYPGALQDFEAAAARSTSPWRRIAVHQCTAFCWLALDQVAAAHREAELARALAPQVEPWMGGKLSWLEARLASGPARLDHLRSAREALAPGRPADCAMVTIELIEELLAVDRDKEAERECLGLCALIERTGNPRIDRALARLIRHRKRLTSELVARIRQALERSQNRRLSSFLAPDS